MSWSRRRFLSTALPLTIGGCAGLSSPGSSPDLVLLGAKVRTQDPRRPLSEAVAIKDGRFLAVGSTGEIRARAGSGTQIVDAGGRCVLPGFIDAHIHGVSSGRINLLSIDCAVTTIVEFQAI